MGQPKMGSRSFNALIIIITYEIQKLGYYKNFVGKEIRLVILSP